MTAQTIDTQENQDEYQIEQGDCLLSIACRTGHAWQTLWDHSGNAQLRRLRKDPTVLLPGDRLKIPPLREKWEDCAIDKRHTFVRSGVPAKLRLRLFEDDTPLKGQPFTLEVGGKIQRGEIDSRGRIEVFIPLDAAGGTVTVGEPPHIRKYQLDFGHLDPVETVSGAQARLANLGYDPGPVDGLLGENTIEAIRRFQLAHELEETGELDAQTQQTLKSAHGS